jgi:hypothetical protein
MNGKGLFSTLSQCHKFKKAEIAEIMLLPNLNIFD